MGGVIQASDGNFYGTTSSGGHDGGTIFRMLPKGHVTTLENLNRPDGIEPFAPLLEIAPLTFAGTTFKAGGAPCGCGTAFLEVLP